MRRFLVSIIGGFCFLHEQRSLGVPLLELALYNKDNARNRIKGEGKEILGTLFLRCWVPSLLTFLPVTMPCGERERCTLDPWCSQNSLKCQGEESKGQGHLVPAGSLLRAPSNYRPPAGP